MALLWKRDQNANCFCAASLYYPPARKVHRVSPLVGGVETVDALLVAKSIGARRERCLQRQIHACLDDGQKPRHQNMFPDCCLQNLSTFPYPPKNTHVRAHAHTHTHTRTHSHHTMKSIIVRRSEDLPHRVPVSSLYALFTEEEVWSTAVGSLLARYAVWLLCDVSDADKALEVLFSLTKKKKKER